MPCDIDFLQARCIHGNNLKLLCVRSAQVTAQLKLRNNTAKILWRKLFEREYFRSKLHVITSEFTLQYHSGVFFEMDFLVKRDSLAFTNSDVLGASFMAIVAASRLGWFASKVFLLRTVSASEALR